MLLLQLSNKVNRIAKKLLSEPVNRVEVASHHVL